MAEIPITLTCECGVQHSARIGDTVTCGCGRVYDTRELEQGRLAPVRHAQAKMRLYITFGLLFIVAAGFIAYMTFGVRGVAVAVPMAGLLWFRLIGKILRRRVFRGAGELPTWRLESTAVTGEPER